MEENRSTITYDENWQDVTEPEYPVILERRGRRTAEASATQTHSAQAAVADNAVDCLYSFDSCRLRDKRNRR